MTPSSLILQFYTIGAVKIDFNKGWILKDGSWSPIYINLRALQSFPLVLKDIANMMYVLAKKQKIHYALVAGIPLGAFPLGVAFSLISNTPHILPRMQSKKHGLGVKVDGVFSKNQKVLVIDDLITAATSKLEAIDELKAVGLRVSDVVVVLDREQGGKKELAKHGIALHPLCTLKELLRVLVTKKKITKTIEKKLLEYLEHV